MQLSTALLQSSWKRIPPLLPDLDVLKLLNFSFQMGVMVTNNNDKLGAQLG